MSGLAASIQHGLHSRITALALNSVQEARFKPLPPAIGSHGPDAASLARMISDALEDAKAENIVEIDLEGKTSIADAMFIATGRSNVHVNSVAERVVQACKAYGIAAPRVEGQPQCDWVLVDANDIIVHIFRPEVRQFYNLEKLWSGDRPAEPKEA